jgi:hypothetical protein
MWKLGLRPEKEYINGIAVAVWVGITAKGVDSLQPYFII